MSVTIAMVKELRQITGAGMTDCKKALQENNGDLDAAQAWLRARGTAIADRKADRDASEGLIAFAQKDKIASLVEILAETDFVTNNEVFRSFAQQVAEALLLVDGSVNDLSALPTADGQSVEKLRVDATLKIGENIQLGRYERLLATTNLTSYIHHDGKIGVLADIDGELTPEQRKQVCMHIASMKPDVLSKDDFDANELELHRKALLEVAATSNKPAEVQEKIVEGKLKKVIAEKALLEQDYVWEEKLTVGKFLEQNKARIVSYKLLVIEG